MLAMNHGQRLCASSLLLTCSSCQGDAARWAAATAALPAPRKPAIKGGGGLGGWISYQLNIKNRCVWMQQYTRTARIVDSR